MAWFSFKQLCENSSIQLRNQLPNNQIENQKFNNEPLEAITKSEASERTEIDQDLIDVELIHNLIENNVSVSRISNCGSFRIYIDYSWSYFI